MEDNTSSPAEKVFGIAELAEHILLSLAEAGHRDTDIDASAKHNTTDKSSHLKQKHSGMQPLACLAAVQRVSCAFIAPITSSKKIKKFMRANRPASHARWLLEDMLGLTVDVEFDWAEDDSKGGSDESSDAETDNDSDGGSNDGPDFKVRGSIVDVYYVDVAEGLPNTDFDGHNADASWRKVSIWKEATADMFINVWFKNSTTDPVVEGHRWWHLGCGATLGMLFDSYCNFVRRVRAEHEKLDDTDSSQGSSSEEEGESDEGDEL